jgi:fructose-1,6-bisphosphatase/sedoheptulose 1,7-bisphosphatase-like protein
MADLLARIIARASSDRASDVRSDGSERPADTKWHVLIGRGEVAEALLKAAAALVARGATSARQVNPRGKRVNPRGKRVNPKEKRVNSKGKRVNPRGKRVNPKGASLPLAR